MLNWNCICGAVFNNHLLMTLSMNSSSISLAPAKITRPSPPQMLLPVRKWIGGHCRPRDILILAHHPSGCSSKMKVSKNPESWINIHRPYWGLLCGIRCNWHVFCLTLNLWEAKMQNCSTDKQDLSGVVSNQLRLWVIKGRISFEDEPCYPALNLNANWSSCPSPIVS